MHGEEREDKKSVLTMASNACKHHLVSDRGAHSAINIIIFLEMILDNIFLFSGCCDQTLAMAKYKILIR